MYIQVNNGPLLYHFSEVKGHVSIELSWVEIKIIIEKIGFKILEEKIEKELKYNQNIKSLLQYNYNTLFFTALKPSDNDES